MVTTSNSIFSIFILVHYPVAVSIATGWKSERHKSLRGILHTSNIYFYTCGITI